MFLRGACVVAGLVLGGLGIDVEAGDTDAARAAASAAHTLVGATNAVAAVARQPDDRLAFGQGNANAVLTRNRTRLTTTGPDVVATAFAQPAITGRAYVEAVVVHGGAHAAGISLWGGPLETLSDDAHPGRSYGGAGASVQAVSAWSVLAYANYGLPGDTKLEMASLSGASGQRLVVQLAVDAGTRAAWVRLSGDARWAGGGNPATGSRPSFVLAGTGPIHLGGNVSSPASHVELLMPGRHIGKAPAGYAAWPGSASGPAGTRGR